MITPGLWAVSFTLNLIPAEIWCDGRRCLDVPTGSRIRVTRAPRPVRLARLNDAPFSTRLVRKFDLPVEGWRAETAGAGGAEGRS